MNKLTIALVATVVNSGLAASSFAAETTNCACVTSPVTANSVIGKVLQSSGEVLYTSAVGYSEAKPGSKLVAGSQVSVGNEASAKISVGSSCKLKVPANSIATLSQPKGAGGKICVKVASVLDTSSDAVQEGVSSQAAIGGGLAGGLSGGLGGAIGAGVVGTAAAGAGGNAAQNEDKDPVKQAENNSDFRENADGSFTRIGGGMETVSR